MKSKFTSSTDIEPRILDHALLADSYGADVFRPDDHKAYVEFEICSALPNIHGPELHGRIFSFHPDVLAEHYQTLLHSQTNINHTLKRHGRASDRINGCVIAVSFPDRPEGGWPIVMGDADAAANAPRIKALAVVHKDASGVPEWIGQHLGGKVKNTVSIEAHSAILDVFDPADLSFTPVEQAEKKFGKRAVMWKPETGWITGKYEGRQLVLVPGGDSGPLSLFGVGYVARGAEKSARITKFAASHQGSGWNTIIASSIWEVGMQARWPRLCLSDAGHGVVKEVIESGSHTMHGITLQASIACPLLRIQPHGKQTQVLRPADRVKLLD